MIRFLDLTLACVCLIVLTPLFFVIFSLVWITDGKPLFFQERVGINGKVFIIVKFRTMRLGTHSLPSHLADNSAITKIGRFLRVTKLDEIPQIWNVLLGEMSFVGPRPCLRTQGELISARVSQGVLKVKPGITGVAQLRKIDMSNVSLLVKTEAEMIRNFNVYLYLRCVLLTFFGKGFGDSLSNN